MREDRNRDSLFADQLALRIAVTMSAILVLIGGILIWSTKGTDELSQTRQALLMQVLLQQSIESIEHQQGALTTWDDAVRQVRAKKPDLEWIDANMGSWLARYQKHDQVYVISPRGDPIYAMRAGKQVPPETYWKNSSLISGIAQNLRSRTAHMNGNDILGHGGPGGLLDLGIVDGHPAVVSIKPIVSDSGKLPQRAGEEFLHVSIRYLDGSYLAGISSRYLFDDVRFSVNGTMASGEMARALKARDGQTIGYLVWKPFTPGSNVMKDLLPALAAGVVLIGGLLGILIGHIRKSASRLIVSKAQAQHLAFHDVLTGLPNRALFEDRLKQQLAGVARSGHGVSLLYLDIDRFKYVNDSFGHPVGDELIRAVSARLRPILRKTDTLARLGGDELAIIQPLTADCGATEILCMRIVEVMSEPFNLGGLLLHVSVSIGAASAPVDATEFDELTRKADIALYRSKSAGRGCFTFFTSAMDDSVRQRQMLQADLRQALTNGGLSVWYQPLFVANSTELAGAEALARWNHPERGVVPPIVFIPIAEEFGLIEALGSFIIREACATAKALALPSISINVSAIQLRNPAFASSVIEVLESTGLHPAKLELEITESCVIEEADQFAANMRALRRAGIRIALDDFGTGYSSLSQLRQLDVDRVKIDRSFVNAIDLEGGSAVIQAIVDLAHATGLRVTAEGVETAGQKQFLNGVGCDELQGFLLGQPMSEADLRNFLDDGVNRSLSRPAPVRAFG
jgi:diguanylate cyclase (GGDEF)-like protein